MRPCTERSPSSIGHLRPPPHTDAAVRMEATHDRSDVFGTSRTQSDTKRGRDLLRRFLLRREQLLREPRDVLHKSVFGSSLLAERRVGAEELLCVLAVIEDVRAVHEAAVHAEEENVERDLTCFVCRAVFGRWRGQRFCRVCFSCRSRCFSLEVVGSARRAGGSIQRKASWFWAVGRLCTGRRRREYGNSVGRSTRIKCRTRGRPRAIARWKRKDPSVDPRPACRWLGGRLLWPRPYRGDGRC